MVTERESNHDVQEQKVNNKSSQRGLKKDSEDKLFEPFM
jgi:hypothetical protein